MLMNYYMISRRIRGFQAKDAGVYSCRNEEEQNKQLSVTIKYTEDFDLGGK